MASSSSSLIPVMKDGECRSWSELPYELTSSILRRLDYTDILVNAQRVCTSWRRVCKDPAMWRKIDMRDLGKFRYLVKTLCRHILDLSQGGLVELDMWYIGPDSLLDYIADRFALSNFFCEYVYFSSVLTFYTQLLVGQVT